VDAGELWPDDPAVRQRWEALLGWLDLRPGDVVLDVGCGRGVATAFIAGQVGSAGRAIGVERHFDYFQSAGSYFSISSTMVPAPLGVCSDVRSLPFADGCFDAVLCVNVLEAIPDRGLALAEMRRVLKPGGRILLAHDDYESVAYAGADRELTRRAVLAYASSTFKSYETSDGEMGRWLWGLFAKAGFADTELRVLPLINTEYRELLHGWFASQFSAEFVAKVSDLTQSEIDEWRRQLAGASEGGDYLYCLNLFVCLGRKPSAAS
jgi:ubiquinone/menaquinone biosynthesis C-methylase UbiE